MVSPSKFRRRDPDEDSPPQPDFLLGETAGGVGPIHEEDAAPRSRSREPEGHEGARLQGFSAGAFDRAVSGAKPWGEGGQATKPQTFDISSHNSGGESALHACHSARDAQAAGAGCEGKGGAAPVPERGEERLYVFSSRRLAGFKFGDGDLDLDKHLEAFQDVCLVVKPKNDRAKLRLFARTLKGTRRRCYDTIVKESKHNGHYEAKPSAVLDRVVAALDASFHESDEAKAMKARAKYVHRVPGVSGELVGSAH